MKMPQFEYARPSSIEEAVKLLAENDGSKILSGGQSLLPILAFRLNYPSILVDIEGIDGLSDIRIDENGLRVGARVKWCQIERDQRLTRAHPLLQCMISHVAHYQIRNRGTVGGSLAHADPAAEMPGLAVVCDAELTVIGSSGERTIQAADFFAGALETVLEADEIITEIRFPAWPSDRRWGFQEFARRRGDFAIAGVAIFHDQDGQKRIRNAHVGVIGASSVPVRLRDVEGILNGEILTEMHVQRAQDCAVLSVDPIEDSQTSSEYRRSLVGTLTARILRGMM
jgi:aerobic carbon-monoxide dehydrogenase medium subunit